MLLPLDQIRLEFQPAENLDQDIVAAYAERLRSGEVPPAVYVYFDGQEYWLADGFHRIAAATLVGLESIEADVTEGTYEDLQSHWQTYLVELRKHLAEKR